MGESRHAIAFSLMHRQMPQPEVVHAWGVACRPTLLFVMAYAVQLHYGNKGITRLGQFIHTLAYIPLVGSLVAFLWGLRCAYSAIVPALGA